MANEDMKIPTGQKYTAVVPDTLDLAQRARMCLNNLTGVLDPQSKFEQYFTVFLGTNPAYMKHNECARATIDPKFLKALPYMRIMCGSDQNLDSEQGLMDGVIEDIAEDGLFYAKNIESRPWHRPGFFVWQDSDTTKKLEEDFANILGNGRLMIALWMWYQRDKDQQWLTIMEKIAYALEKIAIQKDDYAYFPDSRYGEPFSYPKSGWKNTDEPAVVAAQQGEPDDANVFMYYGGLIRALTLLYRLNNDSKVIDFAGKLLNFVMQPKFWGIEGEPEVVKGSQNAHWLGHFPAHMSMLRAILEYAVATGNNRLKDFARKGYEYARNYTRMRIGFIPRGHGITTRCGCSDNRLAVLALMLTDASLGDYWEDIDQYVRNQVFETQLLDADLIREISSKGPQHEVKPPTETSDNVIDRALGGFTSYGFFDPTTSRPEIDFGGCCTSNKAYALYYIWESIVRFSSGTATINLLLNRATPWLDLDSYLPYQGRVVIRNKTAKRVFIRIPLWVDKTEVECKVNNHQLSTEWFGRYLLIESLKAKDQIDIEFPMVEKVEKYQCEEDKTFTCTFKGNTLVDISPRSDGPGYPLYRRDKFKQNKAPTKEVNRYVTEHLLQWHWLNK